MSIILTVWRKELTDVLRDRRRLIWNLVTAFVLMPFLFVAPMGFLMLRTTQQMVAAVTIPVQGMQYAPGLVAFLEAEADIEVVPAEDVEALIREKQYNGGLIVPVDFEDRIERGENVQLQLVTDQSKSLNVIGTRLLEALQAYRDDCWNSVCKLTTCQRALHSPFMWNSATPPLPPRRPVRF
jgi:sodium transport system permease protein